VLKQWHLAYVHIALLAVINQLALVVEDVDADHHVLALLHSHLGEEPGTAAILIALSLGYSNGTRDADKLEAATNYAAYRIANRHGAARLLLRFLEPGATGKIVIVC